MQEQKTKLSFFFFFIVLLSEICQTAVTFVCVHAHACMYAYGNFQPLLWCQPMLSYIPGIEKEMLAPDSQSVLFLGRTYNYSNERIQKHHISWN